MKAIFKHNGIKLELRRDGKFWRVVANKTRLAYGDEKTAKTYFSTQVETILKSGAIGPF